MAQIHEGMADDDEGATQPDAVRTAGPVASRTAGRRQTTHARTDRQSTGRSVGRTAESLYLWRIAHLERRVETLRQDVERKDRDLQRVIERYEEVLDQHPTARDCELRTDGGERPATTRCRSGERARSATESVARVRALAVWIRDRFRSLLP
ncbi:MAG: hypothetical protein ABEJ40_05475 [Haloarculaceae archaeon]